MTRMILLPCLACSKDAMFGMLNSKDTSFMVLIHRRVGAFNFNEGIN